MPSQYQFAKRGQPIVMSLDELRRARTDALVMRQAIKHVAYASDDYSENHPELQAELISGMSASLSHGGLNFDGLRAYLGSFNELIDDLELAIEKYEQ